MTQARRIAGYIAKDTFTVLVWAIAIGVAINLLVYNLPIVFEFFVNDIGLSSGQWFIAPPVAAVVIVGFTLAIVYSGYSRIFIAQGATRGSIALANALALGVTLGITIIVHAVSMLLERFFPWAVTVESQFDLRFQWTHYVWVIGLIAGVLLFGSLIAATFQRWTWLVGVVGLVLIVFGLPVLAAQLPVLVTIAMWPGTPWIGAALVGALFVWVLRGVEVN